VAGWRLGPRGEGGGGGGGRGGGRHGWDAEGAQFPRNAAREEVNRKLQNGMGQPLEALQCVLNLHFVDEDRVRVTAGDSLTATKLQTLLA
jgi:hypothetical protein